MIAVIFNRFFIYVIVETYLRYFYMDYEIYFLKVYKLKENETHENNVKSHYIGFIK